MKTIISFFMIVVISAKLQAQNKNYVFLDTLHEQHGFNYKLVYIQKDKFKLVDSNKLEYRLWIKEIEENKVFVYENFKGIIYLNTKEQADNLFNPLTTNKIIAIYKQTLKEKKKKK